MVVSLQDVKSHLNMSGSENDDELYVYLDAATNIIEGLIGAVVPTQYTEVHDGGRTSIITYHQPVQSVDSITEYIGNTTWTLTEQPVGQSINAFGYTLDDPMSGRITRRGAGSYPQPFVGGAGTVSITYTAGRETVPPAISLAALVIIGNLWQTQRGAAALPSPGSSGDVAVSGMAGALPSLAMDLIEGSGLMRVPGIA